MNVKLFRIMTGEEVIAELLEETASYIKIQNGLVVLPSANGSVGFAPWATVIDRDEPELTIKNEHLVYTASVDEKIKKKYKEIYGSPLSTPDEKKLLL